MAESRLIQKQLAGKEDLLLGIGTVSQARATGIKTITKLNATHFGGVLVVDTINDLNSLDKNQLDEQVVQVKDLDRGGIFIYDSTKVSEDNGGTNFNGWIRQFSGAVNVKWFGADIQKAMTYAIGSSKKVAFDFNATIRIPTDSPTLQQAIDSIEASQGVTIDLLIESGHQPSIGISVSNGDYSRFTISSVDAEVLVSATINTAFLYANNASAPILNCLINAQGNVFQGCYYINGAYGLIESGCGVKNVRERALYVNSSRVDAGGSIFSGAGQDGEVFGRALWATRCAEVNCESVDFTGCMGSSTAVYLSRRSNVHAAYWRVSCPNGDHAVWVHRGSVLNAQEGVLISGSTKTCILASRGSTIVLNGTQSIEGMKTDGIGASDASNIIIAEGVNIVPASGNTGVALSCSSLSRVSAGNLSIGAGFNRGLLANVGGEINFTFGTLGAVTGTIGVEVRRGSKVIAINASILSGTTGQDLRVTEGGQIFAAGATTTNSSPGVPLVTDTYANGRGGFNAILSSGAGIIWA